MTKMQSELESKIKLLLDKFPENIRVVHDVAFKKKEGSNRNTSLRPVLVLSSDGLSSKGKDKLLKEYKQFVTGDYISFSVWEKTTHLFLQKDAAFFDFGFWVIPYWFDRHITTKRYRFRQRKIRFPNSRRIEPLISIFPEEKNNISTYLENLKSDYKTVLGSYYDPGSQITNAQLSNNQATPGHNCTSWITTAPIGKNKECLIELLGSDRSHMIGTNPGWWINFILYNASAERLPLVLYWSPDPMETILEKQVRSNSTIPWDYNKL